MSLSLVYLCALSSEQAKQRPAANVAVPAAPSQLHEMAGYFAIVGMSRLQCLLGDYSECELVPSWEFSSFFFSASRLILDPEFSPVPYVPDSMLASTGA